MSLLLWLWCYFKSQDFIRGSLDVLALLEGNLDCFLEVVVVIFWLFIKLLYLVLGFCWDYLWLTGIEEGRLDSLVFALRVAANCWELKLDLMDSGQFINEDLCGLVLTKDVIVD